MPYPAYDATKPDGSTQAGTAAMQSTRDNLNALRDALAIGALKGYNYSKTDGTGTAAQPQYVFWKNGTEWIRATLTWGTTGGEAGNVTVALCEYSSNSGGAYSTIGTVTLAYDSDGYVVTTTWS